MEKEEKVLEFTLYHRYDDHELSKLSIWKTDEGYILALTPECDPFMFMQPGCDCRSYYLNELAEKLKSNSEINNGWKTCLYGFWDYFEEALKHFKDIEPKLMYRDCFNGLGTPRGVQTFAVHTKNDLEYIKSVLPKIFKCDKINFV